MGKRQVLGSVLPIIENTAESVTFFDLYNSSARLCTFNIAGGGVYHPTTLYNKIQRGGGYFYVITRVQPNLEKV